MILFCRDQTALHGPVNACSPNPVRNAEFTRQLAKAVHVAAWFIVPRFSLRLIYGEFASMMFDSVRMKPEKAELNGFQFRFPNLGEMLQDLLTTA